MANIARRGRAGRADALRDVREIAENKYSIWSWIATVDHKRIGVLYGITAFIFFLVGGVLALLDDFVPSAGDSFTIFTASTLSGQFANASDYVEFSGGRFDVIYSPTSVTLTNFSTVPEPAAVTSLAMTAPLLLRRRRRR